LYNKAFVYAKCLNDIPQAKTILNVLEGKYPDDVLVRNGKILFLGEMSPALKKQSENNVNLIPFSFSLGNNYPNPFNPSTKISFTIPQKGNVKLRVFDLLGREITILADGVYEAGKHEVSFDAGNLPSGVYFYNLTTASSSISKKMLLLK
jgi:hypothetical protein